jgi:hypothetical protein
MSGYRPLFPPYWNETPSPVDRFEMRPRRESLAEFLTRAEPSVQLILEDEHARGWGPVIRTQFDSHSEPIQTYTTALLRTPSGRWIGVRSIFNLAENESAPPLVSHFSLQSAIRWLKVNGFPVPEEYTADDSGKNEKSIDETEPWRLLEGNLPVEKVRA